MLPYLKLEMLRLLMKYFHLMYFLWMSLLSWHMIDRALQMLYIFLKLYILSYLKSKSY